MRKIRMNLDVDVDGQVIKSRVVLAVDHSPEKAIIEEWIAAVTSSLKTIVGTGNHPDFREVFSIDPPREDEPTLTGVKFGRGLAEPPEREKSEEALFEEKISAPKEDTLDGNQSEETSTHPSRDPNERETGVLGDSSGDPPLPNGD